MIRSHISEIGKQLFEGNWDWGGFSSHHALKPLDDCFIDLRILDAAATKNDILHAFQGRIKELSNATPKGSFSIRQPSTSSFAYSIEFVWDGAGVDAVNVKLSP